MIFDRRRNLPVLLLLFAPVAPVGCTGPDVSSGPSSGLTCVDDSPDCVDRRQRTLRYLVDDKDRAWITAHAAARGLRVRRAPVRPEEQEEGAHLR